MSAVDERGGTDRERHLAPLLCELALTAITDAVTGIGGGRMGANVHYRMLAHHVPLTSVMVRRIRDCVQRIPVLGEVSIEDWSAATNTARSALGLLELTVDLDIT